eukprot:COSAG02_NODE_25424_length_659_cov_1.098214_1_plen_104_part_01
MVPVLRPVYYGDRHAKRLPSSPPFALPRGFSRRVAVGLLVLLVWAVEASASLSALHQLPPLPPSSVDRQALKNELPPVWAGTERFPPWRARDCSRWGFSSLSSI